MVELNSRMRLSLSTNRSDHPDATGTTPLGTWPNAAVAARGVR